MDKKNIMDCPGEVKSTEGIGKRPPTWAVMEFFQDVKAGKAGSFVELKRFTC
jgi:hypothetical protein